MRYECEKIGQKISLVRNPFLQATQRKELLFMLNSSVLFLRNFCLHFPPHFASDTVDENNRTDSEMGLWIDFPMSGLAHDISSIPSSEDQIQIFLFPQPFFLAWERADFG